MLMIVQELRNWTMPHCMQEQEKQMMIMLELSNQRDTSVNPDLLISTTEAGESVPDNKTVHEKSSIDTEGTKTRGFPARPRPVQVDHSLSRCRWW